VTRLAFITPAHGRLELTRLCLEQRRRVCLELEAWEMEATCVVIACDENLDTAHALGFDTIEMDNTWLGARFGAGHKRAVDDGATHTMAIGSDSWIDPRVLALVPFADDRCAGTRKLTTVRPDGRERIELTIADRAGYAAGMGVATIYPRAAMLGNDYPTAPNISRGCDMSTWNRTARKLGMGLDFVEFSATEYTDFKSYDEQTTNYDVLMRRWPPDRITHGDEAIESLRPAYDDDLVDWLASVYADRPAWTSR
jgi:hypothetical protein